MSTKTLLGDLARRVRSHVNDRSSARYTDEDIADGLNQAYAIVWAYRPDVVLNFIGEPFEVTQAMLSDNKTTSPISRFFDEPLVSYATAYCSVRDDEHVNSNRMMQMASIFQARITGRP